MSENDLNTHQNILLEEMLKHHEGFRGKAYHDSVGILTIGYGFNIEDNSMCEEAAAAQLRCDVRRKTKELRRSIPAFEKVTGARRAALIDMAYNMGVPGLKQFRKMWAAIASDDWETAAKEAVDSKWYRQVKSRGRRIVEILRSGEWPVNL